MSTLAQPREPEPVRVVQNVRAAFEVTSDEKRDGIATGLSTMDTQLELYGKMGVAKDDLDLHAVFRGQAGYFLLTDDTYNKFTNDQSGNPNKETVRRLVKAGISIEFCSQTMKHHQWTAADILPEVTIVESALTRLIDLQLQNYAYVKL